MPCGRLVFAPGAGDPLHHHPRPHGTLHPRVLSTHPSTIRTGIRVECFLEHEWNGSSDEFLLAGVEILGYNRDRLQSLAMG